jgi:hypothetical protein
MIPQTAGTCSCVIKGTGFAAGSWEFRSAAPLKTVQKLEMARNQDCGTPFAG